MRLVPVLFLLLVACESPDAPLRSVPARAPDPLIDAHAAYLEGDLTRMAARLRETLERPDVGELVRDNSLALLEAGYAVGRGHVDADWALPEGVTELRVMHLRKEEPTAVAFQIALRGVEAGADTVRQLRLLRDDVVVLDREAGQGAWSVAPEPDGGFFFELEGPELREPLDEGLYRVEILLADGSETAGWFILSGLTSTRSPRVDSPAPGEVTGPNPVFRFEDFRSPAHRPWEPRTLGAWAVSAPPREPWSPAWSFFTDKPAQETLQVDAPLAPGDYWFGLNFRETRRFGPLTLVRASRTAVPFRVRP